jgi:phosphoribosyl-AMP cyclohydrolase
MEKTHSSSWNYAARSSVEQVEEGHDLAPKFDSNGCLPCITRHGETGEILMFAFMNDEALKLTITSGLAHYWSRSRQKLWKKGESSGMFQKIQRILIDDDQDCVIIEVTLTQPSIGGEEASCHVGYRSCFYRELIPAAIADETPRLSFIEKAKAFDPVAVYGDTPNPTQL